MSTSLAPRLVKAIVAWGNSTFGAVSPVVFTDGIGNTSEDTGQQFWIGVSQPEQPGWDVMAIGAQSWHGTGGVGLYQTRDDNGDVPCVAYAWNGDSEDPQSVRDTVVAMTDLLENKLRSDPTLSGVDGLLWAEFGDATWEQGQSTNGAACRCRFTIHYRGLI